MSPPGMTHPHALQDPRVVVTFAASPQTRAAIDDTLGAAASVAYLTDVEPGQRAGALTSANAVLAWLLRRELAGPEEFARLESVGLVQLISAGVDGVPLHRIPASVLVASNAGAYADPTAEHVLALALALAKRLPQNHAAMARGEFDQRTPTLSIRDSTAGILGFGGIGQASARLFKAFGARVLAIDRSAKAGELADWVGTLDEPDSLLRAADIVVIALPLTRVTRGLIGQRELSLMKPEAILVNVARAAIIDEDALFEHLRDNPSFCAGIDAWWQEPMTQGSFTTRRPFFELPNLLGSPHNSGLTAGALAGGARRAAENVARYLRGEAPRHVVDRSEYAEELDGSPRAASGGR